MPSAWPRYPSRDQVVTYIEKYRTVHGIEPHYGQDVTDSSGRRRLDRHDTDPNVDRAERRRGHGATRRPVRPSWPGMQAYAGTSFTPVSTATVSPGAAARTRRRLRELSLRAGDRPRGAWRHDAPVGARLRERRAPRHVRRRSDPAGRGDHEASPAHGGGRPRRPPRAPDRRRHREGRARKLPTAQTPRSRRTGTSPARHRHDGSRQGGRSPSRCRRPLLGFRGRPRRRHGPRRRCHRARHRLRPALEDFLRVEGRV